MAPEVEAAVRRAMRQGDVIIHYALSDIKEDGSYGERWLVVTSQEVFVVEGGGTKLNRLPVDQILRVEVHDYVGNAEIEVVTKQGPMELIRFSRSCVEEFRKAALLLNELIEPDSQLRRQVSWGYLNGRRTETHSRRAALKWLLGYLRPYWLIVTLGLVLSVVLTGVGLAPPYLTRTLIDSIFIEHKMELLPILTLALLAVYGANTLLGIAVNYILSYLGQKVIYDMRYGVYEHLQRLSLGFYDRMSSGRILSRVMDDVSRVQWFLVWGMQSLIVNVLSLIGVGVIIFSMNPSLALFVLLPVPVIAVGLPLFRRTARGVYHKAWRKWADVSSLLVDTIPGAVVVKSFARERFEVERLADGLDAVVDANMASTKLHLKFFPLLGFVTSSSVVFIWWFGSLQVTGGTLTPGTLIAFVSYMWMFYGPVQNLSNLIQPLQQAVTSGERVAEVMDVVPAITDDPDAQEFTIKGHVKFENVSFGYEPYIPIVHNINLEIKPGEVIGVVGPSGSGKTTLTKLLLRFYDPSKGRITIDGVDLRKIKLEAVRRQIGLVLQDPFLFDGSIGFNIAYGRDDAAPEEVIAAAKAAHAHEFIMNMATAYDSLVGERGSRLSGGERQRIAIARAIVTDPRILILDEATSSVDSITERHIQEALENLIRGRTTIIIAHRLSTLRRADRIVVLDKGRVVEVGSHAELLGNGGLYSQLYRIQMAEEALTPVAV
ncbi:MAG: ABC transporter ATP-binding protein [Candidatus Bathyarchaeia archaeon]